MNKVLIGIIIGGIIVAIWYNTIGKTAITVTKIDTLTNMVDISIVKTQYVEQTITQTNMVWITNTVWQTNVVERIIEKQPNVVPVAPTVTKPAEQHPTSTPVAPTFFQPSSFRGARSITNEDQSTGTGGLRGPRKVNVKIKR